jgi:molybdopterin-guanine dinucleotide biosynthesis protein A
VRSFDAVILAGGAARRLGGIDKPALEVGGLTLLDRAIDAASEALTVVVVGPERETRRPVTWTMESPPLGGPVAGIAAGMAHVTEARVLVMAADLPFVDRRTISSLLEAAEDQGAVAVDDSGRAQPLLAVYDTAGLRARLATIEIHGAAARSLIEGEDLSAVIIGRVANDCDTWDEVESARARAKGEQIA